MQGERRRVAQGGEGEIRYVEVIGEIPDLCWDQDGNAVDKCGSSQSAARAPGNRNYAYHPNMSTAQARHVAFSSVPLICVDHHMFDLTHNVCGPSLSQDAIGTGSGQDETDHCPATGCGESNTGKVATFLAEYGTSLVCGPGSYGHALKLDAVASMANESWLSWCWNDVPTASIEPVDAGSIQTVHLISSPLQTGLHACSLDSHGNGIALSSELLSKGEAELLTRIASTSSEVRGFSRMACGLTPSMLVAERKGAMLAVDYAMTSDID